MKKTLPCFVAGIAVLLLFSPVVLRAQVKGDPVMKGTPGQPQLQKAPSKLSPDLKNLYQTHVPNAKIAESTAKPAPPGTPQNKFMQVKGDKVVVDITVKDDINTAKAELQRLGLQVTGVYGRVISGIIPIRSLPQLDSAASIRWARPSYKPMHLSGPSGMSAPSGMIMSAGQSTGAPPRPVISQGDTAMLSYVARKKYHVDGTGVKVGVLSDSYNNLGGAKTGVLHGELPGPGNPFHYNIPVQVLEDLDSGGTDEGRAMMEIVHSVAPGSALAFHTADFGDADFAQGIVQLQGAGCDVIADDVIYFAEPFFQDGIIAQAVDQVKGKGATYFSSAGNESIRSYESVFRDSAFEPFGPGFGTAHNFSGPGDAPRYFQPVYIPPGGTLISSFQWDESSFSASGVGCQSDLDIYLLDINGNIVAAGNSDNIASGDPIEVFGYQNTTSNVTFFLVIVKFAGPDPNFVKYLLYDDALFYLTTPAIPGILSPTLVGHAKADGAIATGAAWYLQTPPYGVDTPIVESFSSVGGVANYYDILGNRIAPLIRKKPEIVTPDGVSTSFFGQVIPNFTDTLPHFFGTSAAAPHGAAVAALMIEAQKLRTITPDQIKGILESHTWDMDNPYTPGFDVGFDFATGYGFIKADEAVGEVKFPNVYVKNLQLKALCSDNPNTTRNWEVINPNPFPVETDWLVVGTSQHGQFTVQPGDTTFSTTTLYYRNVPLPNIAVIDWQDNFGFSRVDVAYSSKAVCGKDEVSEINSDKLISGEANIVAAGKLNIAEVYPNPSSNTFRLYLSLAGQQSAGLELFSADGKRLQVLTEIQPNGVVEIDASGYRPGVYVLKIVQGGGFSKTIKLIKQ